MVKCERVCHDKFCFCLVGPFRFEGDGEVTNAVSFDREGSIISRINEKIVTIFVVVWSPNNLYIPISLSIIDYWKILSHLTSGWNIHL